MINNGWKKLNEYYALTDLTPVHYAGIALHPQMKLKYFEDNWPKQDWVETAKREATTLWLQEYKMHELPLQFRPKGDPGIDPTGQQDLRRNSQAPGEDEDSDNNFHGSWWVSQSNKRRRLQPPDDEDAFNRFQSLPPHEIVQDQPLNVFEYWFRVLKDPLESEARKRLAFMGLDILCIPPMSDEPERVFSSTQQTVTKRRNRMAPEAIEAVECNKSWYRNGFSTQVEGTKITLEKFDAMVEELERGVTSKVDDEDYDSEWETIE